MIIFLCSHFHRYTLNAVLRSPALTAKVRVLPYRWLFLRGTAPGATYIFTDHERLAHHELAAAGRAGRSMREAGLRVLNDPAQVRVRFEFLTEFRRTGGNPFSVYRAALRPEPAAFPVFLRSETDHLAFSTDLIGSQADLDAQLDRLERDGVPLRHILVVEFSAAPARPGLYRKHSVYRVGDAFLGYSPVAEAGWMVKHGTRGLSTPEELAAAVEEIDTNPYGGLLRPAFATARIEYGRADFGFVGERLSVFEINTNPAIPRRLRGHHNKAYQDACHRMLDRIAAAVSALDTSGPPVRIDWGAPLYKRMRLFAGPILKQR